MEEEVTKHTRKLYKAATKPGHTVLEKLKEIAVEIFIIVFAVTLSIWLHSWSDHRHEQNEVSEFLKGLREDLTKDVEMLKKKQASVAHLDSGYYFLSALPNTPAADTISDKKISGYLYFDISVIRPALGRYEGFKSSGKMETIEDDSLKQSMLVYYQQEIPDVIYGENFVNSVQLKLLDLQIDNKMPLKEFITSNKAISFLLLCHHNFGNNLRAYAEMLQQIEKIINLIDATGVSHK
jgi:hypothetical protein